MNTIEYKIYGSQSIFQTLQRRARVVPSSASAASTSSSSAMSTVAKSIDPIARAVAGCQCRLLGILRGLGGGVLEMVNDLTDFFKWLAFGWLFDFLLHLLLQSADDEVDAFSLRHRIGDPVDLFLSGSGRSGRHRTLAQAGSA